MDKRLIAKVKQAVKVAREQSTGRIRYSEFIKSSVRELVSAGVRKSELSGLIDVGVPTLSMWTKSEISNYRRVKVIAETKASAPEKFRIILLSGVLIECGSVTSLKSLLEVLK